ncbi:MAG: CopD family protein [Thermoplasmatota archaeon]
MRWWLLLLLIPTVVGHSTPYLSTPASLNGLPDAPEFVLLEFTEPLVPSESVIAIFDDQLLRRDAGNGTVDPENPNAVRLYTGNLIRGIYTISYETRSASDGHYETGSIPLSIGVPHTVSREDPLAFQASDVGTDSVPWLLERVLWALFLGGLAMTAMGTPNRFSWAGVPLAVFQAPHVAGLVVLVAVAAHFGTRYAWFAGAIVYLHRVTLDGHAARAGEWLPQATHGLVMLTWAGALIVSLKKPGNWSRFSRLATGAVAVLFLTAIWLMRIRLQGPADLFTTTYGVGLLAKILLAAGMLWFAWQNKKSINTGPPKRLRHEAVLGIILIFATSVVAFAPIPDDRPPTPPSYQVESWWGDQFVTMDIWPALPDGTLRPGQHEITLTFNQEVEHVEMRFTHRILDVGSIRSPAIETGDGFKVEGTQLGAPGDWDVEIFYTVPGEEPRRAWYIVDIGPLGHVHGGVRIDDPHFDTGYLGLGESYSRYFGEADVGTFECHCHPHQWMECEIEVRADLPPAEHTVRILGGLSDDPSSYRFEPANLAVGAGSTVTWINEGDDPHTATNVQWYQAREQPT